MPTLKPRTALHIAWIGLLLSLPLAFFLGALELNLSFIKQPLSDWLKDEFALDAQSQGEIRLRWASAANITIDDIALYSSDENKPIVELSNLLVVPNLWDLIRGQLSLQKINVDGIRLSQCNPKLPPQKADADNIESKARFSIGELKVRQVFIACEDLPSTESEQIVIEEIEASFSDTEDAWLQAEIRWRDMLITLDARMGNLNAFLSASAPDPYPISLNMDSGDITMESSLEWRNKLLTIEDLRVESEGQILTANGQLALAGSVPKVVLNMDMESLDLPSLWPQANGSVTALESNGSDWEIPLELLKMADANLSLRIGSVQHDTSAPALKNLHMEAELQDEQLEFNVVQLESYAGDVSLKLIINPAMTCPLWTLTGRLENPNLSGLEVLASRTLISSIKAESATVNAGSCGASTNKLLEQLKISVAVNSLNIPPNADTPEVRASHLNLNAGWHIPTLIQSTLEVNGLPIEAKISTGSLDDLQNAGKVNIDLLLESSENAITATGHFILDDDSGYADIAIALASPHPGSLAPLTGLNPQYDKPVHASLNIVYKRGMLNVDNIELAVGNSKAQANLFVNLEDADPEPVFKLNAQLIDLVDLQRLLDGNQEKIEHQNSAKKSTLRLPKLVFDISIKKIPTAKRAIRDVRLTGALNRKVIENATVSADLDTLQITGLLNADFSSNINMIDFNLSARDIELGDLLAEFGGIEDIRAHSERANLNIRSKGRNTRAMLGNTHLKAELFEVEWTIHDELIEEDIAITAPHMSAISGPGQPIILEVEGRYMKVPLNLWLELSPLEQLFNPQAPFPLKLAASTDREAIILAGEFQRNNERGILGKLQFSGSTNGVAANELPVLKGPLPGFEILAEIDFRATAQKSITLKSSMGDSLLNGKIKLSTKDDRNYYDISIKAPSLQTADFSALAKVLMQSDSASNTLEETSFTGSQNSLLYGLDDYLDRIPLNSDVAVDIEIGELYAEEDFLGSAIIGGYADENNVQLNPVKVSLPGGDIDLAYSFKREKSGVKTEFQAHIEKLELGGILRTINPTAKASGLLYLDSQLTAEARETSGLIDSIDGHFDLALFPKNLSASVLDIWASNLFLALVSQADEDRKQTNCLAARFEVEDSIMQAKSLLLDSTDIILRGKGTINLSERHVDLIIAPQSKREKFFSVSSPMSIRGPLDNFEVGLAGTGLVGTLFRWYTSLIYVPWKWLTGERFPPDGIETCYNAMEWKLDS